MLSAAYFFFNPSFNNALLGRRHFEFDIPLWEYEKTCQQGNPHSRRECATCQVKPELWYCVGDGRNWGAVFVDIRPLDLRGPTSLRLAKNSEIVIAHDTNWDLAIWPEDWKRTRNSPEPRIDGRRIFTDKTQTPWASFIQGDLDPTGEIFDSAVERFTSGSVDQYFAKFNPNKSGWGSHIRILAAAALSTKGYILELGTGFFSTPLLNYIIREAKVSKTILESLSAK